MVEEDNMWFVGNNCLMQSVVYTSVIMRNKRKRMSMGNFKVRFRQEERRVKIVDQKRKNTYLCTG